MYPRKNRKSQFDCSAQANKHMRKKVFQPGDLVWVHLQKDRFPTK